MVVVVVVVAQMPVVGLAAQPLAVAGCIEAIVRGGQRVVVEEGQGRHLPLCSPSLHASSSVAPWGLEM